MGDSVKIVECPRDAWQALPRQIPSQAKAAYLRRLIAAGFRHIDAVSFVAPAAVPQMADSEQVLAELDAPEGVEIVGIVVNMKGAERAIATGAVHTLGFPYSISPQFLARNQRQTLEESLDMLEAIGNLRDNAGLDLVAYVSMAFGNPYGDAWSIEEVADACDLLVDTGVEQISLADTVGLATPEQIRAVLDHVLPRHSKTEIGVHLHARPEDAAAKVRAAYQAGCRRFDAAIGGLGGCPFAQDALVGNLPTEALLAELKSLGAQAPQIAALHDLVLASAEIARNYGPTVQ